MAVAVNLSHGDVTEEAIATATVPRRWAQHRLGGKKLQHRASAQRISCEQQAGDTVEMRPSIFPDPKFELSVTAWAGLALLSRAV